MTLAAARELLHSADRVVERLSSLGQIASLPGQREVDQLLANAERHLANYYDAHKKLLGFSGSDPALTNRPASAVLLLQLFVKSSRYQLSLGAGAAKTAANHIRASRRRVDSLWEKCIALYNPFGMNATSLDEDGS